MFDSFFLGVLVLLAFPVMAIVALIRANEARGLLLAPGLKSGGAGGRFGARRRLAHTAAG